ncbi:hypothetical protein ACET3Z_005151 [Daucus carota]
MLIALSGWWYSGVQLLVYFVNKVDADDPELLKPVEMELQGLICDRLASGVIFEIQEVTCLVSVELPPVANNFPQLTHFALRAPFSSFTFSKKLQHGAECLCSTTSYAIAGVDPAVET